MEENLSEKNSLEIEKEIFGKEVNWEENNGRKRFWYGEEKINLEELEDLIRKEASEIQISCPKPDDVLSIQRLVEIGNRVDEELPNELEIEYGGVMRGPNSGFELVIKKLEVDATNSDKEIPGSAIATLGEVHSGTKELSTGYVELSWF